LDQLFGWVPHWFVGLVLVAVAIVVALIVHSAAVHVTRREGRAGLFDEMRRHAGAAAAAQAEAPAAAPEAGRGGLFGWSYDRRKEAE
jgi:hypothetical protein